MSELEAQQAIRKALEALRAAYKASEAIGYGSQVMAPLSEAIAAAQIASDTAEGRV
jgi:hypothetical protein